MSASLDRRDPEELGYALLTLRDQVPSLSLSAAYDWLVNELDVPDYDSGLTDHVALRQQELEARAAEGDKYAILMLRGDGPFEEGNEG